MRGDNKEQAMKTSPEIPDDLIEIRDPEIDPAQIMQEIRRRVAQRRQEAGYDDKRFPTYGGIGYPGEPSDMPYDLDLYHSLRAANEQYAHFDLEPNLAPSPATRLPIVGRLWSTIRQEVHRLVLFYVNRAIRHQVMVNRSLVQVVNRLTTLNQEQQRDLKSLRRQLADQPDPDLGRHSDRDSAPERGQ